jgi:hypothetical protein
MAVPVSFVELEPIVQLSLSFVVPFLAPKDFAQASIAGALPALISNARFIAVSAFGQSRRSMNAVPMFRFGLKTEIL